MSRQLFLYRTVADAWGSVLGDWLKARAGKFSETPVWVVAPTFPQAAWLRQQALEDGLGLFGIDFLTPANMRRELCRLYGVDYQPLGRESLEFLLKLEAGRHATPHAKAVAAWPAECLRALDDLGRAGWTGDETDLGEVPSPAGEWIAALASSKSWLPILDRTLLEAVRKKGAVPLEICFWGGGADRSADMELLTAAASAATSFLAVLPEPQTASEVFEQAWVTELEARLGVSFEICPASPHVGAYEAWVETLSREGEGPVPGSLPVPEVLVGRDRDSQLALAVEWTAKQLVADENPRIGLIAPGASDLSLALLRALEAAGIEAGDEVGAPLPPDRDRLFQLRLAAYFLGDCRVDDLLALAEVAPEVSGVPPVTVLRSVLHNAFKGLQTRDARMLMAAALSPESRIPNPESILPWLEKMAGLPEWTGDLGWTEAKEQWRTCLAPFGLDVKTLEPLWSRLDGVLTERKILARMFLEYVEAILPAAPPVRAPQANRPFARVLVVTPDKAAGQMWSHLLWLDANEGAWPRPVPENPFLPDRLRRDLNRRRKNGQLLLPTSLDIARLEEGRMLGLLEHCTKGAALLSQVEDPLKPGQELHPNEWVVQALLLSGESEPLPFWHSRAVKASLPEASVVGLPEDEKSHLADLLHRRRDPETPFDEYQFVFGPAPESGKRSAWPAAGLDNLVSFPGESGLDWIFDARSGERENFERAERWIVGTLVHQWLAGLLKNVKTPPGDLESFLAAQQSVMEQRFEGPPPLWWRTMFRRAGWTLRRCVQQLSALDIPATGEWKTEETVSAVVSTPAGDLALRGRMDLLIEGAGWRQVIDFKTGKQRLPNAAALARGEGLQFAAYLLMALAEVPEAGVHCVSLKGGADRALTTEEKELAAAALAPLARMQANGCFGPRGPFVSDYGSFEILPAATVMTEASILEAKWKLQNGESEMGNAE